MFERYTEQARRAIFFARREALLRGESSITPVHLLLGLSMDEDSLANSIGDLKNKLCDQLLLTFNTPMRPCRNIPYSEKPDIPLNQESKNALPMRSRKLIAPGKTQLIQIVCYTH
jgi:hypothetical protein